MNEGTLEDAGWRGGLEFTRVVGRVKLSETARVYSGRWVDLVGTSADGVVVFIWPTKRYLNWDEVTHFKFTADEFRLSINQSTSDLLWFARQIFNGIDTGMVRIETPAADETLANVLARGRAAVAKAKENQP